MSTYVVGVSLDHAAAADVSDVIGPFDDAATAHDFADKYCPPIVLDNRTRWFVVGVEACQYSPQAWIDLQLGDDE